MGFANLPSGASGSKDRQLYLSNAGLMWLPFVALAVFGAARFMNNLSSARSNVKDQLVKHGKVSRGRLGVTVQAVSDALNDASGKPIVTVMPVMTRENGGRQLRIPAEAGYDGVMFEVGSLP